MTDWLTTSAFRMGDAIATGAIDPVELAEFFLDRIAQDDPDRKIFVRMDRNRTLSEAHAARSRQKAGIRLSPFDGVPISWKDLVDVAGVETNMAARALKGRIPAHDAEVLARATRCGTVFLGKTNLTEFAFSGLGINTTYGTPANPHDSETDRIPGGSSSGAGVAVARGLGPVAIGSDTGGSVRIPASLNGVTGLKTTLGALPMRGVLPLASRLDSIGPLTRNTTDAAIMWSILSGQPVADTTNADLENCHLVTADSLWRDLDPEVERACNNALESLRSAGATIRHDPADEFSETSELAQKLITTDAWSAWKHVIEAREADIFPPMLPRFQAGQSTPGSEILQILRQQDDVSMRVCYRLAGCDAMIAPTVPILPPAIEPLLGDRDAYMHANRMCLRNTTPVNVLNLCAMTIPCGVSAPGLPVGLMLIQQPHHENRLLRLGKAVERALSENTPDTTS